MLVIKDRHSSIIFQASYQISSELDSGICMEELGASITKSDPFNLSLCFQQIFCCCKTACNLTYKICLKFHSTMDRSLNSSIACRKSRTIFMIPITDLRLDKVHFQAFSATLRFLNLAVKIFAGSTICSRATQCCCTTLKNQNVQANDSQNEKWSPLEFWGKQRQHKGHDQISAWREGRQK